MAGPFKTVPMQFSHEEHERLWAIRKTHAPEATRWEDFVLLAAEKLAGGSPNAP